MLIPFSSPISWPPSLALLIFYLYSPLTSQLGFPHSFSFFFSLIDSAEITENKHTNLCPWALEAKGLVIGCFKELVVHIIILSVSSLVVLRRLMEGKRGGKGWLTHGRDTYICSLRKIKKKMPKISYIISFQWLLKKSLLEPLPTTPCINQFLQTAFGSLNIIDCNRSAENGWRPKKLNALL